MILRWLLFLALACTAFSAQTEDCATLDAESDAYREALEAMSGHFPVPLKLIKDCGKQGFSKLFKAKVPVYESEQGWSKSGSLGCFKFSQHKEGEPYSCGRSIVSTHAESGFEITSNYEIALATVDEVVSAIRDIMLENEVTQHMNYVVVKCGGTWSLSEHGFSVQVRSTVDSSTRHFYATKNCSPTPCLWNFEETTDAGN